MSEWQPIETAPDDGTPVDLWVTSCADGSDAGDVDFYTNGLAKFNPKTRRREGRVTSMVWKKRGYNSAGWHSVGGSTGFAMHIEATHWRHLPDPPKQKAPTNHTGK